jgi:hypothetical protein
MTQGMKKEPILQMGTDRMIPRHISDKPFTVRFLDRSCWKDGFQPGRKGELTWYTDGSKTSIGTGVGVYAYDTMWKPSFSLGLYTTIFQADCALLRHAQSRILDRNDGNTNIYNLSDS